VAEQAFTVPVRAAVSGAWVGIHGEGFEVLSAERHRRKLKRGALRANDFEIVLRDVIGDTVALEARLAAIAKQGVPNYFGPQRFGREGGNLAIAERWFADDNAPADRFQRGFALSAARAWLFNAVLAARVSAGTWSRLQPGDVANLDGSGSVFSVAAVDDVLAARCAELDVHPTGPLWGAGAPATSGAAAAVETTLIERHARFAQGLAAAGLVQERRALRLRVADLRWSREGSDVRLCFRLSRGAFATAVLHELVAGSFDVGEED